MNSHEIPRQLFLNSVCCLITRPLFRHHLKWQDGVGMVQRLVAECKVIIVEVEFDEEVVGVVVRDSAAWLVSE